MALIERTEAGLLILRFASLLDSQMLIWQKRPIFLSLFLFCKFLFLSG